VCVCVCICSVSCFSCFQETAVSGYTSCSQSVTWTLMYFKNLLFLASIGVIFNTMGLLVGSWLHCIQHLPCLVSFWSMLGGSVEV
jgi:hypothetical protein